MQPFQSKHFTGTKHGMTSQWPACVNKKSKNLLVKKKTLTLSFWFPPLKKPAWETWVKWFLALISAGACVVLSKCFSFPLLFIHTFPLNSSIQKMKRSKCQQEAGCFLLGMSWAQSPRTACDPWTKTLTAGGHIKKFSSWN